MNYLLSDHHMDVELISEKMQVMSMDEIIPIFSIKDASNFLQLVVSRGEMTARIPIALLRFDSLMVYWKYDDNAQELAQKAMMFAGNIKNGHSGYEFVCRRPYFSINVSNEHIHVRGITYSVTINTNTESRLSLAKTLEEFAQFCLTTPTTAPEYMDMV